MKTTKKTKTTPSVVVTPAAPASPGGYTIGLDFGDRSHYHCVLAATGQLIQPKTKVAPAWGSTRVPRVGFGVPPKPRLTIQAPGSLWIAGACSRFRAPNDIRKRCRRYALPPQSKIALIVYHPIPKIRGPARWPSARTKAENLCNRA